MEESKKNSGGLIVLVVILLIACVGMGAFIFINKDNLTAKENTQITTNNEKQETTEKIETSNEKANTVETRKCTGIYTGTAAISGDIQTKQYVKGTLTIELKSDGTFELKKENMNGASGNYIIIEDALLLKTLPDISVQGATNDYSILNISNDCSTLSTGYGSFFFDPAFTLTKQK